LIASGFFDLGRQSAEGITSFYDPEYKKYSLGKYLIYQKINYCRALGLKYFYPGYFVPGYRFFDYKLSIGRASLEYLQVTTGKWLPIGEFIPEQTPIAEMRVMLEALLKKMPWTDHGCDLVSYEYFDANLVPELQGAELLDYPLFLYCFDTEGEAVHMVIVYDPVIRQYKMLKCLSVWTSGATESVPGFYSRHLLKLVDTIASRASAEEMNDLLQMMLRERGLPSN
jgi:arginine-tRNA-protein transferase